MSKLWFLPEGTYILMKKPLLTILINGKQNTLKVHTKRYVRKRTIQPSKSSKEAFLEEIIFEVSFKR